jgi:hypothetical protein
VWTAIDPES